MCKKQNNSVYATKQTFGGNPVLHTSAIMLHEPLTLPLILLIRVDKGRVLGIQCYGCLIEFYPFLIIKIQGIYKIYPWLILSHII